jgi:thioredoxin-dependent peroxiredoxin
MFSLHKRLIKFGKKVMAKVTLKGNPVNTSGNLPVKGSIAPAFTLVKSDLSELSLAELKGKKLVLNIFPSLDTSTCAISVRKFNQLAAGKPGAVVLGISKDLPFAHGRFCSTEGITNVITLSGFRDHDFGKAYGVDIIDGPLKGLYARSIVIIDEKGKVIYTQLVPEISHEPDYDAALAAV